MCFPQAYVQEAIMETFRYVEFAEALVLVHGSRAKAEAALQAAICERAGDTKMVETWGRVLACLTAARPPEYSRAA
jgi:hypothetical protein